MYMYLPTMRMMCIVKYSQKAFVLEGILGLEAACYSIERPIRQVQYSVGRTNMGLLVAPTLVEVLRKDG